MTPAKYECPKCKVAAKQTAFGEPWAHCSFCDVDTVAFFVVDDLVRAVLAQQWAVAITLVRWQPRSGRHNNTHEIDLREGFDRAADVLEELPCAVDVVAEMLGAPCP